MGAPTWVARTHVDTATGAFGGAPYGSTIRAKGAPKFMARTHVDTATGAFGGAPYEATKRVRGVPKCGGGCKRTLPQRPSVELHMGPRSS